MNRNIDNIRCCFKTLTEIQPMHLNKKNSTYTITLKASYKMRRSNGVEDYWMWINQYEWFVKTGPSGINSNKIFLKLFKCNQTLETTYNLMERRDIFELVIECISKWLILNDFTSSSFSFTSTFTRGRMNMHTQIHGNTLRVWSNFTNQQTTPIAHDQFCEETLG